MIRKFDGRALVAMAVLALALLVAACGGGAATPVAAPKAAEPTKAAEPAKPAASGAMLINGAGATFPFPLYSRWFYEYAFVEPSVKFNYQSIGSGGGIKQIKSKTVDFAGSDALLTDADYKEVEPARLQMLPTVAGAVVPTYNVSELKDKNPLTLDGQTLTDIFMGKIKKWNDPAIAALNSKLTLPNKDIIVVHRSDGSGTTSIFTSYLLAVSSEWKEKVGAGTSVNWPVGLGGKGNEGVAGTVSQNDGSIGYVELAYARQNKLPFTNMKNTAGNVVTASGQTTQNAEADFGGKMPETLAASIVNATGKDSWPIAGYTYLIVYMDQTDCTRGQKVVEFIKWALSDQGSKFATELEYVPLPDNIRQQVLAKLGQMTCQGKPLGSK
ncbi:MAG: phosphate ABC transporter substrate-binding protein PstS [Chloroflexi bacterium RBG_16_57_9]|nr:MAG: phosphate ABC transporter substrate-binding protein PstS [Chloroflexi bacterium RBG_16_57_9]